MKIWRYIDAHHEEMGIALFVLPALLVGLAIVAVGRGIFWLICLF